MKNILHTFFKFCPKTGKFRGMRKVNGLYKLLLPLVGLIALIWILIRVIPKPSRINYPCVKAAMPLASGFIAYIALFIASAIAFIKLKKPILKYQFLAAVLFAVIGIGSTYYLDSEEPFIIESSVHEPNEPIGEAKGIFPGRVVWVHDPEATNENCVPNSVGHGWWMPENNDQEVIDEMVSKAILSLTGQSDEKDAWDEIFKYHNNLRGKGSIPYQEGEKIFIKINNVSGWGGNFNRDDLSVVANGSYGISETSPQVVLSVLRQLVNVVGVSQSDIYIGDPMRNTYKHSYDMWHNEFPDIHYMSHDNFTSLGREQFKASTTAKIFYSDKGEVLRENVWDANRPGGAPVTNDFLYKIFEEVEYLINLPMLKGHKRAGMTMFAKNHFGSHTRPDASHLHNGLIDPQETPNKPGVSRTEYGMYRVQVDLMSHKLLGGKSLFYLMDALWAADQEIGTPKKFTMEPFNTDWMSSVFASLDPVAIESVGYDFLRSEFTSSRKLNDNAGTYVQKPATDDYLHQAADSANWPENVLYDPENDSILITSLGVHEHWNNPIDKEYTRNLETGEGIELVKIDNLTSVEKNPNILAGFSVEQNYPNPFNPVTTISFSINKKSNIFIKIFDITGKEIATLLNEEREPGEHKIKFDGNNLSSGIYFYQVSTGKNSITKKMILLK